MEQQYIGIDLHKASFHACAVRGDGSRIWEAVFPRTRDGVTAFAARDIAGAALAVEATGPTWPFVDAMSAYGVRVCVVDARKTKLKAGFAAKTDRLDARRLADALRRDSVTSVYIPPSAIRELRELSRGRQQVVRLRTKVVQAIRALLLRQDAPEPPVRTLTSRAGLAWLQTVHLGPSSDASLRRLERVLHTLQGEARQADGLVRQAAADDPIVRALTRVRGVGPILGVAVRAEIGAIDRFATGAALACYAGIVPNVHASGSTYRSGAITRAGSPWLRWALVEIAVKAMRQPDPLGRWARRLAVAKGIKRARVALARRLCDQIVREWRQVG
ncbi:MAG TPA: IS110 family transposase [Vicinamibacterales bacterium]|nr:IS110 family transposase [Vicinamibacterales bacterium]